MPPPKNTQLTDEFKQVIKTHLFSLDVEQRQQYIKSLKKPQLEYLWNNPDILLFDKQIIPEGNWRYCILRCGRRFGKGFAGSAWLAKKILAGHKKLALCGATYTDTWKIMVPNLQAWFPKGQQGEPNMTMNTLTFPNGAIVYCHTSDKEIRGYGVSALWCDELSSWCGDGTQPDLVEERFNILDTTVSEGSRPQTIITSTPKPFPLWEKWQKKIEAKDPRYSLMTGNMDDNPYLSESFKQGEREKYGSGRFGKQEYYGDLMIDVEGALWQHKWIDDNRITELDQQDIIRTVVIVDPAASTNKNSDETGIIVASLVKINCHRCGAWTKNIECEECRMRRTKFKTMQCVILNDSSGKYTPDEWSKKVNYLFNHYNADKVIAEKNMGGDMVTYTLRASAPNLPLKLIHASKGKIVRAEPIAALYEQGKVKHLGEFPELEKQLTSYTGLGDSPDRLDALVMGVTELMLETNVVQRNIRYIPNLL